jgi:hypothetical protein
MLKRQFKHYFGIAKNIQFAVVNTSDMMGLFMPVANASPFRWTQK